MFLGRLERGFVAWPDGTPYFDLEQLRREGILEVYEKRKAMAEYQGNAAFYDDPNLMHYAFCPAIEED